MVGRFFITLILGVFAFSQSFSRPVLGKEVKDVSEKFISDFFPKDENYSIKDITPTIESGKIVYYKVSLLPQGWILVSGDDIIQPVIGYSYNSSLSKESAWLPSTKEWFNGYKKQIVAQIKSGETNRNRDWDSFETDFKSAQATAAVDPLISVEWNQSSGWNEFCPADENGPGGHAYVGCVAVAMAQAISVYKYPQRAIGKHGYNHDTYGTIFVNYDFESDYDWNLMSDTKADVYNARLLYHCAVSVDMGFGPDGSGAYTREAKQSLAEYFGYPSSSLKYQNRGTDDEAWEQLLIDELDAGHPIVYDGDAGDGKSGHAFNIDGYTKSASGCYFHLNWGWSGSNNGNFTINNLAIGTTYDFTKNHGALTGIRKPVAGPTDIVLSNKSVKENLPIGSFVALVDVEDELPNNKYTYELFGAAKEPQGYYPSKFIIENDSLKTNSLISFDRTKMLELRIEVTDSLDNVFVKEFNITVLENDTTTASGNPLSIESTKLNSKVFPNPAIDFIFFNIDEISTVSKVSIYNTNGKLIINEGNISENGGLNVSELPAGLYIAVINTENKIFSSKFLKN